MRYFFSEWLLLLLELFKIYFLIITGDELGFIFYLIY